MWVRLVAEHRAWPEDRIEHLLGRQVPIAVGPDGPRRAVASRVSRVWRDNFEVYGAEKVWRELSRQDRQVHRGAVDARDGSAPCAAVGRSAPPSRAATVPSAGRPARAWPACASRPTANRLILHDWYRSRLPFA